MKKPSIYFLFLTLILSLFLLGDGTTTEVDRLEPINPVFVRFVDDLKQGRVIRTTPGGYLLGYVPPPVDMSHVRGVIDEAVNTDYPARFDLREQNLVTAVKEQDPYPTCWVFAAFASLESCMLPDEVHDFSEWHVIDYHGFDYGVQGGGNSWITSAYLTGWSGPVNERWYPYPTEPGLTGGAGDPNADHPLAKHVQQVIFLPERTGPLDNNTIKYFLMNHGPVDFAMHFGFEDYNDINHTIYDSIDPGQNHRLVMVGWDDHFSKERFIHTPPGDGAFIARNSWGADWGEGGYCYISYYDPSLEEFTSFNNAEAINNYETIYQHDPLGRTGSWGDSGSAGANVFVATHRRSLEAVGFYTNDANTQFNIRVFKNLDPAAGDPTAGTLAITQGGTYVYPGYYTVELNQLVPLERGEVFSVAVQWITPNHNHSVPIERQIYWHSSRASANAGESYVSLDGVSWQDLALMETNSNVCIKAYTQFPEADIDLQVERKTIVAWIIRRDYADISVTVNNIHEIPVARAELYRKLSTASYILLQNIPGPEITDGFYQYTDEYLEVGMRCSYKVILYDIEDNVIGRSGEVNI